MILRNLQRLSNLQPVYTRSFAMKAIRVSNFGDESVMKLQETEIMTPEADEVLVKVEAAGINPVDTYIRTGNYLPSRLPKLPYTPGGDVCGTVTAIGNNISEFQVGDKVFSLLKTSSGAYAEYSTVKEPFAVKLPQGLSYEEGSAVGVPYFTAYRALKSIGKAHKGEKLLIHGASGGVGTAAIQIAKFLGLSVVGTAGSNPGMKILENLDVIAYNHKNEGYVDEISKNEGKFDIIIEMLANKNLQNDLTLLGRSGRIMIVGCRGEITINPRLLMGSETQIRGVGLTAFWDLNEKNYEILATMKLLNQMAEANQLKPILGKSYALGQAQIAHKEILENDGAAGKVYFKM